MPTKANAVIREFSERTAVKVSLITVESLTKANQYWNHRKAGRDGHNASDDCEPAARNGCDYILFGRHSDNNRNIHSAPKTDTRFRNWIELQTVMREIRKNDKQQHVEVLSVKAITILLLINFS